MGTATATDALHAMATRPGGLRCTACGGSIRTQWTAEQAKRLSEQYGLPLPLTFCGRCCHTMVHEATGLRRLTRDEAQSFASHPEFAAWRQRIEENGKHLIG